MSLLLAQAAGGLVHWIVIAIVVVAVVAIFYVAMKAMGMQPPPWVIQIFWIVVIAVVAIVAIKFLLSVL